MAYRVSIAGVDTSRLPKLSKQESEQFLNEISCGDNTHRDYFLTANLRLVLSIVHRFNYDPSLADDVFQVGCLGLVKALNNFEWGVGIGLGINIWKLQVAGKYNWNFGEITQTDFTKVPTLEGKPRTFEISVGLLF